MLTISSLGLLRGGDADAMGAKPQFTGRGPTNRGDFMTLLEAPRLWIQGIVGLVREIASVNKGKP
jgi:hypothetical protein